VQRGPTGAIDGGEDEGGCQVIARVIAVHDPSPTSLIAPPRGRRSDQRCLDISMNYILYTNDP